MECDHGISSSAYRCPNCGAENAGERAYEFHIWKLDREHQEREKVLNAADPGRRERLEKEETVRLALLEREKRTEQRRKKRENAGLDSILALVGWYLPYFMPLLLCVVNGVNTERHDVIIAGLLPVLNWVPTIAAGYDYYSPLGAISLAISGGFVFYAATYSLIMLINSEPQ
jgi:hypothetical protein